MAITLHDTEGTLKTDPLGDYPPMMRDHHVAEFLDVTVSRLAQWRGEGVGPPYVKLTAARNGAVRYPREGLRAYVADATTTPGAVAS